MAKSPQTPTSSLHLYIYLFIKDQTNIDRNVEEKDRNKPWKEDRLRVLEAMSLEATLPQFPLPTIVTLNFGWFSCWCCCTMLLLTGAMNWIEMNLERENWNEMKWKWDW